MMLRRSALPSHAFFHLRSMLALASALIAMAAHAGPPASVAAAPNPSSAGSLFQVLMGLVLVLGLLAAAAWMLKRFNPAKTSGGPGNVRIVGGVSVGSRERVIVVEVADQWIVVGVAPGRVNALSTMPRQETAAAETATAPARNFSAWLKQTIDSRNARR